MDKPKGITHTNSGFAVAGSHGSMTLFVLSKTFASNELGAAIAKPQSLE